MARGPVPPWRRVADDLRRRIEEGEFVPGSPLPSLSAVTAEYGVSRTTGRKAYSFLIAAGIVTSTRGWGYFIAE